MRRRYIDGKFKENGTDLDTILLLHFDNNVIDSTGNSIWQSRGSVSYSSDCKFGSRSIGFSNSDIMTTNEKIRPTNKNWTIDWWDKKIGTPNGWVFHSESSPDIMWGLQIGIQSDGSFRFELSNGPKLSIGHMIDKWRHVAVVCSDGIITIYINGESTIHGQYSGSLPPFKRNKIGYYNQPVGGFLVDEFRISNIDRWNSDFTPSDIPYSYET